MNAPCLWRLWLRTAGSFLVFNGKWRCEETQRHTAAHRTATTIHQQPQRQWWNQRQQLTDIEGPFSILENPDHTSTSSKDTALYATAVKIFNKANSFPISGIWNNHRNMKSVNICAYRCEDVQLSRMLKCISNWISHNGGRSSRSCSPTTEWRMAVGQELCGKPIYGDGLGVYYTNY